MADSIIGPRLSAAGAQDFLVAHQFPRARSDFASNASVTLAQPVRRAPGIRVIATVGSMLANNDDVPNEGMVTVKLKP